MADNQTMRVEGELIGQRLDAALAATWPEITRSQWQQRIRAGEVVIDGKPGRTGERLRAGQLIEVASVNLKPAKRHRKLEAPHIEELYRDDDVIVINKPAGINVHATSGPHHPNTIASIYASDMYEDDSGRAGIVHRLDKDTSGVMILARTPEALEYLQAQFKARSVDKHYTALVWGKLDQPSARIELPLARHHAVPTQMSVEPAGRPAITEYSLIQQFTDYCLLDITLLTGRTHQIRVHFNYLGHPVVGDKLYGHKARPEGLTRQFLHATSLGIELPGGDRKTFLAPLPIELQNFLENLV